MNIEKLGTWTFNLIEYGTLAETKTVEYTGINEVCGMKFETTFMTWLNDMLYIFWELQKQADGYYYINEKFAVTIDDANHKVNVRLGWLEP